MPACPRSRRDPFALPCDIEVPRRSSYDRPMEQRRQVCCEVEAVVLPELQRPSGAASGVLAGHTIENAPPQSALPMSLRHWSLSTLLEKLPNIGAKVVQRTKYVTFQIAETVASAQLFAAILDCSQRFAVAITVGTASLTIVIGRRVDGSCWNAMGRCAETTGLPRWSARTSTKRCYRLNRGVHSGRMAA